MHWHKLYNHKKQGWSAAGPCELYILQCDFIEMVRGIILRKSKLSHENPKTTVENYFVMDAVLDQAGNAVLGIIGKNERYRLPQYIELFYFHKQKTNATMKHTKAARLFEQIFAVENDSRGFQHVHVSFQSTPSFNISSINAINECNNFF